MCASVAIKRDVTSGWWVEDPQQKFRELILWLCARSETDPYFGATKLNKLLFFIDLEAMKKTGMTITKERYQKLPQGPAPRAMVAVLKQMEQAGDTITRTCQVFSYPQRKTIALREPNLGVFSANELGIMEQCVKQYWRKTAKRISMASHDFIGWQIVGEGDDIPFGSIFISKRPLTPEEVQYGKILASELT